MESRPNSPTPGNRQENSQQTAHYICCAEDIKNAICGVTLTKRVLQLIQYCYDGLDILKFRVTDNGFEAAIDRNRLHDFDAKELWRFYQIVNNPSLTPGHGTKGKVLFVGPPCIKEELELKWYPF